MPVLGKCSLQLHPMIILDGTHSFIQHRCELPTNPLSVQEGEITIFSSLTYLIAVVKPVNIVWLHLELHLCNCFLAIHITRVSKQIQSDNGYAPPA